MPGDTKEIVEILNTVRSTGRLPSRIFRDWIATVESLLRMLPAHAKHVATTKTLAPDDADSAKLWERLRHEYHRDIWALERFAQATGVLLQTAYSDGRPTYVDIVGDIYMEWSTPLRGQEFTPMNVARLMVELVAKNTEQVIHTRLKDAYHRSPLAQAAAILGIASVDHGSEQIDFADLLPLLIDEYQPVTLYDPCCGSGRYFVAMASVLPQWMTGNGLIRFYGQDVDATCVLMTKVNLMLYGLNGYAAALGAGGDSLERATREEK